MNLTQTSARSTVLAQTLFVALVGLTLVFAAGFAQSHALKVIPLSGPEVDALLNEARSKQSVADRLKAYEQVNKFAQNDNPILYLYHRNWLWAYNAKLSGVREVPDGLLRVTGLKMN